MNEDSDDIELGLDEPPSVGEANSDSSIPSCALDTPLSSIHALFPNILNQRINKTILDYLGPQNADKTSLNNNKLGFADCSENASATHESGANVQEGDQVQLTKVTHETSSGANVREGDLVQPTAIPLGRQKKVPAKLASSTAKVPRETSTGAILQGDQVQPTKVTHETSSGANVQCGQVQPTPIPLGRAKKVPAKLASSTAKVQSGSKSIAKNKCGNCIYKKVWKTGQKI
jgi:hypothetical protein